MNKNGSIIIAGALGAVISFGMVQFFHTEKNIYITQEVDSTNDDGINQQVSFKGNSFPSSGVDFTNASEKSVNGVVHIKTRYLSAYSGDPFYEYFFGSSNSGRIQEASGSGVIISADGYIATNNHVIDGADEIKVTLNNQETYTATLIGRDPSTDLALLKIEGTDLPYVDFANSDDVKIGEWVLAVGNPFNLTSTVTAGIVSAKSRNINLLKGDNSKNIFPIESFIQTDAAVNPGNSGGALVNPQGELIGINTAIASKTGSYAGYSFAIPSNIVKKVTADLVKYGVVQRAFVGVGLANINQQVMEQAELPNLKGVLVTGVAPNSAAFDGGIKSGDVILKVAEDIVSKVPEIQEKIGNYRPGDEVMITIRRGDLEQELNLILKNQQGTTDVVKIDDK